MGNRSLVDNHLILSQHNIDIIINLSDDLIHNQSHIKIFNIPYKDNRSITYHQFIDIAQKVISIINHANQISHSTQNILIICDKAINRSVSVAIAYAIIQKKMTLHQANQYIELLKNLKYPHFNNLTNPRIQNLLKVIESKNIPFIYKTIES